MNNDNLIDGFSKIERDNIALIKRSVKEVWNEQNEKSMHEIYSANIIWYHEHEIFRGINSWKEKHYDVVIKAFPDVNVEIEGIMANGDYTATRWVGRGTFKNELFGIDPTNKIMEVRGTDWTRLADGKVVENWNYWDMTYVLKQQSSEIKELRSILPLCSFCKKIRDDKGYWEQVDVYIHKYSQADISHSICPECAKEHYPDLDIHE